MDLGIYIIVSALVGAKLLLVMVEWDHFSAQSRAICCRSRGRAACSTAA